MTVSELYYKVLEGLQLSAGYLFDPNKRVFFVFLLSSLCLAFWVYRKEKIKGSFIRYVFHPKVWLGYSPRVDYAFLFLNGVVKVIIVAPLLVFGLYLSFYVKEFLLNKFGYVEQPISEFWVVTLYTLSLFVVKDLSSYLVHLAFHKIPWLWRFHKTHHSATVLNPLTQYRIHPLELIANNLKGIFVFGLVTGLFDYVANGEFNIYSILGVNVIGFVFMAFGANLRHSHVKLKYPNWLENVFISPLQHQIHHSHEPIHYDKNLGSVLAIWDCLFGTIVKSKAVNRIHFGLGKKDNEKHKTFFQNLFPR